MASLDDHRDGKRTVSNAGPKRRAMREGRRGRWRHVYAALDLGTNNCRLLVAKPTADGFRVVDAFSRIVRLGEGMGTSGAISDAAMNRTLSALKVCAGKMRRRQVTRMRNVATEACRRARNCDVFIERVHRETGIELEIISAVEEARLAVSGCRALISSEARYALVFDIGGGSTELIWLDRQNGDRLAGSMSLPVGVVNLSEGFGGSEVSSDVYERMIDDVRGRLSGFCREHRIAEAVRDGGVQMLGTSGTVTTLTSVLMDLPKYDRAQVDGAWLSFEDAFAISNRLRCMAHRQRVSHPCIGSERADFVVAGCAILEAICRTWPVGNLRVADRGLREGMLQSLMHAADREYNDGARA